MSKENPRFPIVFIDADETLLDFSKSEKTALKQTLESNGYLWSEDINAVYMRENLKIWKQYEQNQITRQQLQTARFKNFFAAVHFGENADFCKINGEYVENLSHCGFLLEGAYELCQQLSKYVKIFITTNGLKKAQHGRFEKSGLNKFIVKKYISEEMNCQKPNAEYFEYIFNEQHITDKGQVIVLGDSLTSDMQGGRNAGITTCLFDPQDITGDNPLCDYRITRLSQFFDIVL